MKRLGVALSYAVVFLAAAALATIYFFTDDGRHSDWLLPLMLCSLAGMFSITAFSGRKGFLPRGIALVLFWISLIALPIAVMLALLQQR